mmetsp:Transcript_6909/g.14256  ORF Transcript_6909/g.14256 Transcript_6909/m.14256 type:complete len:366 (-) Transcript_6909:1647-2744(-)
MVECETLKTGEEWVELTIGGRSLKNMDFWTRSDPFVVLFRAVGGEEEEDGMGRVYSMDSSRSSLVSVSSEDMMQQKVSGQRIFPWVRKRNVEVQQGWIRVGQTETIWDNLDPMFMKKFYFRWETQEEREVWLQARFYDQDAETVEEQQLSGSHDFIGSCEFFLQDVVSATGLAVPLKNNRGIEDARCGFGYFVAEKMPMTCELSQVYDIDIRFSRDCNMPTKRKECQRYFVVLSRRIKPLTGTAQTDLDEWIPVYRTGARDVSHTSQELIRFQQISLTAMALYGDHEDRPLKIQLFCLGRKGNHLELGRVNFSITTLREEENRNRFELYCQGDLLKGSLIVNTAFSRLPGASNSLVLHFADLLWS